MAVPPPNASEAETRNLELVLNMQTKHITNSVERCGDATAQRRWPVFAAISRRLIHPRKRRATWFRAGIIYVILALT